ncbi:MAG TPA: DedA family protein [Ktedonobacterales bacterium]|nr:DedA family protein [Ktedonobacterales bacterium]
MPFPPGTVHLLFHLLHHYGLLALFILLVIEEAGVPIPLPGDALIALAGAQPHATLLSLMFVLLLSALASFLGSSALYWVMRRGGRPVLHRLTSFMRLHPERMERMEHWFVRHGSRAIMVGRLIPGLRVPTSVMSGISGIPYRVYAPANALSALIWAGFYLLLGRLGQRYLGVLTALALGLLDALEDSLIITCIVVGLLILALVGAWHIYRRLRQRSRQTAESTPYQPPS